MVIKKWKNRWFRNRLLNKILGIESYNGKPKLEEENKIVYI